MYISMGHIFSILIIRKVWNYVNQFAEFNRFTNSPVANYKGELYSACLLICILSIRCGELLHQVKRRQRLRSRRNRLELLNLRILEEQAISLVGTDIYEKLIKGYTDEAVGKYLAINFLLSLLRDCRFDLPLIIIILMHFIREFL